MPRIACLLAVVAIPAATLLVTGDSTAAAPARHAARTPPRPAPSNTLARPVVASVAVAYPAYATTSRSTRPFAPFVQSRTAGTLSYLPPVSPDAPRFSFSPQDPPEGWHWQRVSLQQLDAEVRARRAERVREGAPR